MSGEKTEKPTSKKLQDERKKGRVAKSKDVAATVETVAMLAFLFGGAGYMTQVMLGQFDGAFRAIAAPNPAFSADALAAAVKALALCSVPVLLLGVVMVIVGNVMQFGFLLSWDALKPQPDKFNPAANLKMMFSADALFEFLMGIVKLAVLSWIFWYVASRSLNALITSLYAGVPAMLPVLAIMLKKTIIWFSVAFAGLSAADFAFRKFRFLKQNMMTKEEVKREFKDSEGDPHIKHRRRQMQEEAIEHAILEKTRQATVLVVNPTHYAVALYYDENGDKLPVVLGKGVDRLARRMMKVAEEEGIPIMRDVPLARGLYAESVIDHQIPVTFIKPVAETLKWARRFKRPGT